MCKRQREIHISWMKHLSAMNTSAMLSTEAWKTLITWAKLVESIFEGKRLFLDNVLQTIYEEIDRILPKTIINESYISKRIILVEKDTKIIYTLTLKQSSPKFLKFTNVSSPKKTLGSSTIKFATFLEYANNGETKIINIF